MLDEIPFCAVCLEQFSSSGAKIPWVIKCHGRHSFCNGCLEEMYQNSILEKGTLACPLCRGYYDQNTITINNKLQREIRDSEVSRTRRKFFIEESKKIHCRECSCRIINYMDAVLCMICESSHFFKGAIDKSEMICNLCRVEHEVRHRVLQSQGGNLVFRSAHHIIPYDEHHKSFSKIVEKSGEEYNAFDLFIMWWLSKRFVCSSYNWETLETILRSRIISEFKQFAKSVQEKPNTYQEFTQFVDQLSTEIIDGVFDSACNQNALSLMKLLLAVLKDYSELKNHCELKIADRFIRFVEKVTEKSMIVGFSVKIRAAFALSKKARNVPGVSLARTQLELFLQEKMGSIDVQTANKIKRSFNGDEHYQYKHPNP